MPTVQVPVQVRVVLERHAARPDSCAETHHPKRRRGAQHLPGMLKAPRARTKSGINLKTANSLFKKGADTPSKSTWLNQHSSFKIWFEPLVHCKSIDNRRLSIVDKSKFMFISKLAKVTVQEVQIYISSTFVGLVLPTQRFRSGTLPTDTNH